MADFLPAYAATNRNEGGFANNPKDKGGMTAWGIARIHHPGWKGWPIIDMHLKLTTRQPSYGSPEYSAWVRNFNAIINVDKRLKELRVLFYEMNFWKASRLGEIQNQAVAEWIYDHVVNAGGVGIMWAQLAARVKPDGGMGPVTIGAINGMPAGDFLLRAADIAGAYRLDRASADPSQIQFLRSWLTRDGQPESIIQMVRNAVADGRLSGAEVAAIKSKMLATA